MTLEESSKTESKLVHHNEYVYVYDDGAGLLTIKWKRQIDFDERVNMFLWARQYSMDRGFTKWLLNDEQLYIITSKEREWVVQEWPPLAAQAGIRKIAVLLPDVFGNTVLSLPDFTRDAQEHYKRLGVTEHEVFTDRTTAINWLHS